MARCPSGGFSSPDRRFAQRRGERQCRRFSVRWRMHAPLPRRRLTSCTSFRWRPRDRDVARRSHLHHPRCQFAQEQHRRHPHSSRRSLTDPFAIGGFTPFSSISGPRGNPPVAGPDAYGISEAWFRRPGNATVVRAQAHGAPRQGATDSRASAWTLRAQDAAGNWGPVFAGARPTGATRSMIPRPVHSPCRNS